MTWTSPHTAVTNEAVTAAYWNAGIRDNLLASEVALASGVGNYFVANGANALGVRSLHGVVLSGPENTSSTAYANVATVGPSATMTTGTSAIVWIAAEISNSAVDADSKVSFEVSGATAISASDTWAIVVGGSYANSPTRRGCAHRVSLTAGSNTFTMKYAVSSGVGTFGKREIDVLPF